MKKFISLILSVINAVATYIHINLSDVDVVPTHFNIIGEADEYGSKWGFMIFPIIIFIISVIYFIRCIYIKKNQSKNTPKIYDQKTESKFFVSSFVLLIVFSWFSSIISLNNIEVLSQTMRSVFCIIFGVYIIYLSNMYGKIKYKSVLGIRNKATLSDSTIWKKAHRLGGYLGVVSGIAIVIFGIILYFISIPSFGNIFLIFVVASVLMAGGIPAIYAKKLYNKNK